MKEIKITIKLPGNANKEITQEIEDKTFDEITKICKNRKADISDLLINDLTEMTPEEAENILLNWDI